MAGPCCEARQAVLAALDRAAAARLPLRHAAHLHARQDDAAEAAHAHAQQQAVAIPQVGAAADLRMYLQSLLLRRNEAHDVLASAVVQRLVDARAVRQRAARRERRGQHLHHSAIAKSGDKHACVYLGSGHENIGKAFTPVAPPPVMVESAETEEFEEPALGDENALLKEIDEAKNLASNGEGEEEDA